MLAIALYVVGAILLLIAAVTLLVGGAFALFLPQLIVALAIERWRYKPVSDQRPDPRWTDTGERFVDPETGVLTAVYFDAANGERHYLAVPPRG
jgi:hypothetical protein